MKKLKWKKGKVDICTPFLKIHRVKGYICGWLGVHKIPDSKPTAWSITHMVTGLGVVHSLPAFRTMAQVKEFGALLLADDNWFIEGAEWGDVNNVGRSIELWDILHRVKVECGYVPPTDKLPASERDKERHICSCGKIAQRYMLSTDRQEKWKHYCLQCKPYGKETK